MPFSVTVLRKKKTVLKCTWSGVARCYKECGATCICKVWEMNLGIFLPQREKQLNITTFHWLIVCTQRKRKRKKCSRSDKRTVLINKVHISDLTDECKRLSHKHQYQRNYRGTPSRNPCCAKRNDSLFEAPFTNGERGTNRIILIKGWRSIYCRQCVLKDTSAGSITSSTQWTWSYRIHTIGEGSNMYTMTYNTVAQTASKTKLQARGTQ